MPSPTRPWLLLLPETLSVFDQSTMLPPLVCNVLEALTLISPVVLMTKFLPEAVTVCEPPTIMSPAVEVKVTSPPKLFVPVSWVVGPVSDVGPPLTVVPAQIIGRVVPVTFKPPEPTVMSALPMATPQ